MVPYDLLFMEIISPYMYSIAIATLLALLSLNHQISLYNELMITSRLNVVIITTTSFEVKSVIV